MTMKRKVVLGMLACMLVLSACSNSKFNNGMESKDSNIVFSESKKSKIDDIQNEEVVMNERIVEDKSNSNSRQEDKKKSSNAKRITSCRSSKNQSNVIKEEPKEEKVISSSKPNNEKTSEANALPKDEKSIEPSKPTVPSIVCPNGKDPSIGCDVILDTNYYFMTFASEEEAMIQGQYYLDEVVYLEGLEITNYSIQTVYRNDHSVAYYGLNFWSNGTLIQ